MACMAAGSAAAAASASSWNTASAVQTLESTLETLRLPTSYAPSLVSILGPWERILEVEHSKLAMPLALIMPVDHASRFVGYCAMVKQKRERAAWSVSDLRWRSDRDAIFSSSYYLSPSSPARDGIAFSSYEPSAETTSSASPSSRSSSPRTADEALIRGQDGPFQCLKLVGQSLKKALDALARKDEQQQQQQQQHVWGPPRP